MEKGKVIHAKWRFDERREQNDLRKFEQKNKEEGGFTITELGNLTHDYDYWCDVYVENAVWNKTQTPLTENELNYLDENYADDIFDVIPDFLY